MRKVTKIDAILSLVPGAQVVINGSGEDEIIEWHDPKNQPVTGAQIEDEYQRLISHGVVPDRIPVWAARTVLQGRGLLDQANELVSISDSAALKNVWEYGNEIVRTSAALSELSGALGLTSQQVDEMFLEAAGLTV